MFPGVGMSTLVDCRHYATVCVLSRNAGNLLRLLYNRRPRNAAQFAKPKLIIAGVIRPLRDLFNSFFPVVLTERNALRRVLE